MDLRKMMFNAMLGFVPDFLIACLLGVHSRYGLHTRTVTVFRDPLSEGFSHFVTSMTAPVASGWSGCRVGLAPTGKRRLFTAHAISRLGCRTRTCSRRPDRGPR